MWDCSVTGPFIPEIVEGQQLLRLWWIKKAASTGRLSLHTAYALHWRSMATRLMRCVDLQGTKAAAGHGPLVYQSAERVHIALLHTSTLKLCECTNRDTCCSTPLPVSAQR